MPPRLLTIHYNERTFAEKTWSSPLKLDNYKTSRVLFDGVIICIYFGEAQWKKHSNPIEQESTITFIRRT